MRLQPRFQRTFAHGRSGTSDSADRWLVMQPPHHIVGSESLDRRIMAPGYGAMHRGIGSRRRRLSSVAAMSAWAFLAVVGLSVVGALTGAH